MSTHRGSTTDYIDQRFREAPRKAAEILIEHQTEWSSVVDAYWLLRRYEDEIGVPITYDIVEKAYEIALRELRHKVRHAEIQLHKTSFGSEFSGKASASNI